MKGMETLTDIVGSLEREGWDLKTTCFDKLVVECERLLYSEVCVV